MSEQSRVLMSERAISNKAVEKRFGRLHNCLPKATEVRGLRVVEMPGDLTRGKCIRDRYLRLGKQIMKLSKLPSCSHIITSTVRVDVGRKASSREKAVQTVQEGFSGQCRHHFQMDCFRGQTNKDTEITFRERCIPTSTGFHVEGASKVSPDMGEDPRSLHARCGKISHYGLEGLAAKLVTCETTMYSLTQQATQGHNPITLLYQCLNGSGTRMQGGLVKRITN